MLGECESDDEVDRISDEHLSPTGAVVRIGRIEADLAQEVDSIIESIVTAGAGAAQYRADLADAHSKLDGRSERIAIRSIVQSLVQSTREMELRNLALEKTLEVSRRVIEGLQKDMDNIRSESMKDALTLLANRKHFDMALAQAVADATDRNAAFSILMIDIDHFKRFNDIYGHQVGDEVLRVMGRRSKTWSRVRTWPHATAARSLRCCYQKPILNEPRKLVRTFVAWSQEGLCAGGRLGSCLVGSPYRLVLRNSGMVIVPSLWSNEPIALSMSRSVKAATS